MKKFMLTGLSALGLLVSPACSQAQGLINGKLVNCPGSPNCQTTEYGDLAPTSFSGHSPEQAWLVLQASIVQMGGTLQQVQKDYLSATFSSKLFKFVDDLEARIDAENQVIHLRSASRTGYYDFHANRDRLIQLQQIFANQLNPERLKNIYE